MVNIILIVFIIMGAIFHEYSHGWVADRLGDPTARNMGRLTLNPIAHLDPFGSVILPISLWLIGLLTNGFSLIFAYAKPVPYNPYNLKDQKKGPALIAGAGPLSNLLIAFVLGMIIRFFPLSETFSAVLGLGIFANVLLAVFNVVPIPPLDGSKLLFAVLPDSAFRVRQFLERYGFFVLIIFIFSLFRLISPIIVYLLLLFAGQEGAILTLNVLASGF